MLMTTGRTPKIATTDRNCLVKVRVRRLTPSNRQSVDTDRHILLRDLRACLRIAWTEVMKGAGAGRSVLEDLHVLDGHRALRRGLSVGRGAPALGVGEGA